MPSTPPRRKYQHNPPTPQSKNKKRNGLFYNNEWRCNCEPRQRAVQREVRSDRPTKGQRFFTCAQQPRCRFFLWEDEAKERTKGRTCEDIGDEAPPPDQPVSPVLTQRRLTSLGFGTQPDSSQTLQGDNSGETIQSSDPQEMSPPSSPSLARKRADGPSRRTRSAARRAKNMQTHTQTQTGESSRAGAALLGSPMQASQWHQKAPMSPSKRKRTEDTEDEDEKDVMDLSDMSSEEERELADLTDQMVKRYAAVAAAAAASRDRGKAQEQATYETPSAMRTIDVDGLPTPVTNRRHVARNIFPEAGGGSGGGAERERVVMFDTPSSSPSDDAAVATAADMTNQVLALLRPHGLPASTMEGVSDVLNVATKRVEVIARGRETAREAVRRRDEEVATLRERVRQLENKERMYETQVASLKAGIMRLYQEH